MDIMSVQPNEQEEIPILTAPRMRRTPSEEELELAIAMSLGAVEDDVVPFANIGEMQVEFGKSEGADSVPGLEAGGETIEEEDSESDLADKIVSHIDPASAYPTLDELGLEVKHVLNDGNCEFEAIRDQLRQLGYAIDDHSVLRMMFGDTIQQMKENPDPHWKDVLDALDAKDLTEIFFEGRWANDVADLFPQVAANMFRCAIHIYSEKGVFMREVRPEGIEGDIEDVARVIYNGHHYDSTRLKGSGKAKVLYCRCGKCADKIRAFQQGPNSADVDDPDSRRNQFMSPVDVIQHIQKLQKAKFVQVMEDMQITDRVNNEVVDVHSGTILEVLRQRDGYMLVHSEDWVDPQRIEMNCYYKLDPYITQEEKENGEIQANAMLKLLQKMLEVNQEKSYDFEVGDRVRASKDMLGRRFVIYKNDVWKVAMITDDTVTLTNGVDPKLELPSNSQTLKHFKKVVNLDDVESTVQAKAYIVQEPFRHIPEGTRLVVTSVMSGETTVYHKTLLEVPIVLTKEELAKCKLESDLIEFETKYTLRGRSGKIATYFEKTQKYRVQYIDGTSSDYSHDELVNEIAYSKEMDVVDDDEEDLEDKTPFMIPNGKRDIVSSMKQMQIQGKWYNETGSNVFGFVQGSKYFPEDKDSETGYISINKDDLVTLQLGEGTRCGTHATWAIFWENGEVWYHESNIQKPQEQDDRILADQIADSNERIIKRDILQRASYRFQDVQQQKLVANFQVLAGYGSAPTDGLQEKYGQMCHSSEQFINAQFAKKPGFNYSSRGAFLHVADLVLGFLYGRDSPIVQFANKSKIMIYLTMTASLLGWPFVRTILKDEETLRSYRLFLLSDEALETWNDALNDEVKKYNDATQANKSALQNLLSMGAF